MPGLWAQRLPGRRGDLETTDLNISEDGMLLKATKRVMWRWKTSPVGRKSFLFETWSDRQKNMLIFNQDKEGFWKGL